MRKTWAAGALALGLSVSAPAWAQTGTGTNAPTQEREDGCPADCPMHAEGGAHAHGGKGGCPMMAAKQAGVKAKVEETDRGAVIRLEGPKGNTQARDEARKIGRHVAKMTEEGCPHAGGGESAGGKAGGGPAGEKASGGTTTPGKQTSKGG